MAIYIDSSWVSLIKAPHIDLFDVVIEDSSCLEVIGLVFLDWVDWKFEEVRATHNVALEANVERITALVMIL